MLGTYYFTLCFSVIEINGIFVQLCGLSPIYVATHEPGRNNELISKRLSSVLFLLTKHQGYRQTWGFL